MLPHHEHWYKVLREPTEVLRQGDILLDITGYWLPDNFDQRLAAGEKFEFHSHTGAWIVASASCDLDHASGDSPQALVAMLKPLTQESTGTNTKEFKALREVMRRNCAPGAFLVSDFPDTKFGFHFADLQTLVSLPLGYLRRQAREHVPRLRMRSPFREDFAAMLGRHVSRVGLEDHQQIPRFGVLFPTQTLRAIESQLPPDAAE